MKKLAVAGLFFLPGCVVMSEQHQRDRDAAIYRQGRLDESQDTIDAYRRIEDQRKRDVQAEKIKALSRSVERWLLKHE